MQHDPLPRLKLVEADAALKIVKVGDQVQLVQTFVIRLEIEYSMLPRCLEK